MNIFFSYTVRDGLVNVGHLRRITKRLEVFSRPYIDLLEHRCGGHQPSVRKAIYRADAFLLCVTPQIFDSPWVTAECITALKLGVPIYAASSSFWFSVNHPGDIQRHLTNPCNQSRLALTVPLSRFTSPAVAAQLSKLGALTSIRWCRNPQHRGESGIRAFGPIAGAKIRLC